MNPSPSEFTWAFPGRNQPSAFCQEEHLNYLDLSGSHGQSFFVSRVHIWIHFSQQKVSVAEVIYLNGFVIYEVAAFCPEAFSLHAGPTKELIYCNKLFPLSLSLSLALFSIFFRTNFFNEWSFTLREFAHVIISLFWHNRERSKREREWARESARECERESEWNGQSLTHNSDFYFSFLSFSLFRCFCFFLTRVSSLLLLVPCSN